MTTIYTHHQIKGVEKYEVEGEETGNCLIKLNNDKLWLYPYQYCLTEKEANLEWLSMINTKIKRSKEKIDKEKKKIDKFENLIKKNTLDI